jgi:AbrB family looped-hinge helix DNA binding protein
MARVTITSKRQATLPAELCDELGVQPGDQLNLERKQVAGQSVWVITGKKPDWSWLGAARAYAQGKSHQWADIEESIEQGWADDDRA